MADRMAVISTETRLVLCRRHLLRPKLGDHCFNALVCHVSLVLTSSGKQAVAGEATDRPGDPFCQMMDHPDGIIAEQGLSAAGVVHGSIDKQRGVSG